MAPSEQESGEKHPRPDSTAPRLFRRLSFKVSGVFLVWLCVLGLGLGLVGLGIAYQLTGTIWAAPVGFLLGATVALGLARDFARWRLSLVSLVSALVFVLLFIAAQWLSSSS
jgi:hypothetical protein